MPNRLRNQVPDPKQQHFVGNGFIFALPLPFLLAGLLYLETGWRESQFVESVHDQAARLATLIEKIEDPVRIASLADDLILSGQIVYADYQTPKGEHIVSGHNPHGSKFVEDSGVGENGDNIYYLAVPARAESRGLLRLGFSELPLRKSLEKTRKTILLLVGGYLLLTLAMIVFYGRLLRQSLRRLNDGQHRHPKDPKEVANEARLAYLATHDYLTGLPNRALFGDRLNQVLAHAARSEHVVALFFIDLDRFKEINDSLGHHAGDQILQAAARRLRGCLRSEDTLARLGGDEFTLILPRLEHPTSAALVASNIVQALERPFPWDGRELYISCSIGIAFYPMDGNDATELWRNADAAMYAAKRSGGHGFRFHSRNRHPQPAPSPAPETGLESATPLSRR